MPHYIIHDNHLAIQLPSVHTESLCNYILVALCPNVIDMRTDHKSENHAIESSSIFWVQLLQ